MRREERELLVRVLGEFEVMALLGTCHCCEIWALLMRIHA